MHSVRSVRPVFTVLAAMLFFGAACFSVSSAYGAVLDDRSQSGDRPSGNFGDFLEYDGENIKEPSEVIKYEDDEIREYIQNVLSEFSDDPGEARERLRKFGPAAQDLPNYLTMLEELAESDGKKKPPDTSMDSNIALNILILMNEDHPENSIYRYYLVDEFFYSSYFLNIDQRQKHIILYNHLYRKMNIGVDLMDLEKHLFLNSMKFLRKYGFRYRTHYSNIVVDLEGVFPSIAGDRPYEIELRREVCGSLSGRACFDALNRQAEAYTGIETRNLFEDFFCRPIVQVDRRFLEFEVC